MSGMGEGLAAVSFQGKSVGAAEVSETIQSPLLPGRSKAELRETGLCPRQHTLSVAFS